MTQSEMLAAREAAKLEMLAMLPADIHDAVRGALVSRGGRRDLLLATAPSPMRAPLAFAAWHAIRAATHAAQWGHLPNDCGVAGMMMAPDSAACSRVFDLVFDVSVACIKRRRAA